MPGERGFRGGALTSRGVRFVDAQPQSRPAERVDFSQFAPGEAVMHLGGQYHAAEALTAGCRVNLVVWLFGAHGVVRVAPHDAPDRLRPQQRWGAAAAEEEAAAMVAAMKATPWVAAESAARVDAHPGWEEQADELQMPDQAARDEL